MDEALKLKKKYNTARGQLFDNLISNNDGFIFNNQHTKLVDDIVRDLVQNIIKEYSSIAVFSVNAPVPLFR